MGYKVAITGSASVFFADGSSIPAIHIWPEGDGDDFAALLGCGMLSWKSDLLAAVKQTGGMFAIEACDEKRQRIFTKLARRAGFEVVETSDSEGESATIVFA
jgi:hypothetical protein